jgi:hypothetical protein
MDTEQQAANFKICAEKHDVKDCTKINNSFILSVGYIHKLKCFVNSHTLFSKKKTYCKVSFLQQ